MLTLLISQANQPVLELPLSETIELGRQRLGEPEPFVLLEAGGEHGTGRVVVAARKAKWFSRRHIIFEPLGDGRVRVLNLSRHALMDHTDGRQARLAPYGQGNLAVPFQFQVADLTLKVSAEIVRPEDPSASLERLGESTVGPDQFESTPGSLQPFPALASSELDGLVRWLQTTLGVIQSAIGSANFVNQAVEALVQIVGLHSGRVLLYRGGVWQVAALARAPGSRAEPQPPSATVLDKVRSEKCTFVYHPGESADDPAVSLLGLQAVVAAPILDSGGVAIGALYGERGRERDSSLRQIGKIEATLVELLACGVATGLARQQHEQHALRARVQFEQFFTAELAEHLAREPNLLEGREAEVSLLFGDVRSFSRVSERLGPAQTMVWIGEVMDALSACVLHEGGVLVDYVGDEILAMWGAPEPQADHARRAARAALAMRAAIEMLSRRWQPVLGEATQVGVGINTGPAQVGNSGSRYKFKYGPLGSNVNLASRVQGATKYLKCTVLATAATQMRLGAAFLTRRICRAAMQGIVQPVDLFEVAEAGSSARADLFRGSSQALAFLEQGNNAQAARLAGTLLLEHAGDGPLLMILGEAVRRLQSDTTATEFVWQPPGK